MGLIQMTNDLIEKLKNRDAKGIDINAFETQVILNDKLSDGELRETFRLLLDFIKDVNDQTIQAEILSTMVEIMGNRDVEKYINWNEVQNQLPFLSEKALLPALEMFYSKDHLSDIPLLKKYLHHPSLEIRMNALNVICEIVIASSDSKSIVRENLRTKQYSRLLYEINNPNKRVEVTEAELEARFAVICDEAMEYIQTCLDQQRFDGHFDM